MPIRVYSDLDKIIRILPQYNVHLETCWIHDKARYFFDALNVQRITSPLIRKTKLINFSLNSSKSSQKYPDFIKLSWKQLSKALFALSSLFNKNYKLKTFVGNYLDLLTLLKVKKVNLTLGFNNIYNCIEHTPMGATELINEDFDINYLFKNYKFSDYKSFFLVNLNLRFENPVLNSKLRNVVLWKEGVKVYFFGPRYSFTNKYTHLGTTTRALLKFIEGRYYLANCFPLKHEKNPQLSLILYGSGIRQMYKNTVYKSMFNYLKKVHRYVHVNYLARNVSSIGAYDLALSNYITKEFNSYKEKLNTIYHYIGCNDFEINKKEIKQKTLSIYQNSHFPSKMMDEIDCFLPSKSPHEIEKSYFINCFGILQIHRRSILAYNNQVKDDIEILKILFNILNTKKKKLIEVPKKDIKTSISSYLPIHLYDIRRVRFFEINLIHVKIHNEFIYYTIMTDEMKDFYTSDLITALSRNMNSLSYAFFRKKSVFSL